METHDVLSKLAPSGSALITEKQKFWLMGAALRDGIEPLLMASGRDIKIYLPDRFANIHTDRLFNRLDVYVLIKWKSTGYMAVLKQKEFECIPPDQYTIVHPGQHWHPKKFKKPTSTPEQ